MRIINGVVELLCFFFVYNKMSDFYGFSPKINTNYQGTQNPYIPLICQSNFDLISFHKGHVFYCRLYHKLSHIKTDILQNYSLWWVNEEGKMNPWREMTSIGTHYLVYARFLWRLICMWFYRMKFSILRIKRRC